MTIRNSYQNTQPSLNFDFVNSQSLDPRVDYSRGSTALYFDGKTYTRAEENLVYSSEDFTDGGWINGGVTIESQQHTAPDGSNTATKLIPTTTNDAHRIRFEIGPDFGATAFVWLKAAGYDYAWIAMYDGADYQHGFIDLTDGSVSNVTSGVTVSVEEYGNGWYRGIINISSTSRNIFSFGPSPSNNPTLASALTPEFSGDGTSGILCWGAQMVEGDRYSTYVKTTGSPVVTETPTLIEAAVDEPRFDHDTVTGAPKGLLFEPTETNYITNSTPTSGTVDAASIALLKDNAGIAPDGTNTSLLLREEEGITQQRGITFSGNFSNTSGTFSIYVKHVQGQRQHIQLRPGGIGSGHAYANFDVVNGTIDRDNGFGGSEFRNAYILDHGNGWYRCVLQASYSSTPSVMAVIVSPSATGSEFPNITGDGFSAFLFWGAQYESDAGKHTSLIPTNGAEVTRSRDLFQMENIDQDWYTSDQGTVYAEYEYFDLGEKINDQLIPNYFPAYQKTYGRNHTAIYRFRKVGESSFNNQVVLGRRAASGSDDPPEFSIVVRSYYTTGIRTGMITDAFKVLGSVPVKSVFSYRENKLVVAGNGFTNRRDDPGLHLDFDYLYLGHPYNGETLAGHIKRFAFYPKFTDEDQAGEMTK